MSITGFYTKLRKKICNEGQWLAAKHPYPHMYIRICFIQYVCPLHSTLSLFDYEN